MPTQSFLIKTSKALEDKVRAKKVKNIWYVPNSKVGEYYKVGSWYPTAAQARAHITRALPGVVFKESVVAPAPGTSQTSAVQSYNEPTGSGKGGKKGLLIAGGTVVGLTALGFAFRKKIAKLLHR